MTRDKMIASTKDGLPNFMVSQRGEKIQDNQKEGQIQVTLTKHKHKLPSTEHQGGIAHLFCQPKGRGDEEARDKEKEW